MVGKVLEELGMFQVEMVRSKSMGGFNEEIEGAITLREEQC